MNYRYGIPEGAVYYNQPNTAAVIFDPEGGRHVCYELYSPTNQTQYWCAGRVGPSPEWLADRIHADWYRTDWPDPDEKYARQEQCFGEQP